MSEKVATCFTRAFGTPDGQRVLEHLEKMFPENTTNQPSDELRYYVGQRNVIKVIHKLIEKGKEND